MKPFKESLRYEYPLTPDSLVLDVGCFLGEFSRNIASLYGCRILAFEPVREHFVQAVCNTMQFPTVCVINAAVGAGGSFVTLGVSNNSSGAFSQSEVRQEASVVKILPLLKCLGAVDLMKLNVEGGEYDILQTMVDSGMHLRVKNIQVQWHSNVPDWEARYKYITGALGLTHEQEWSGAEFTWENWRLR